MERVVFEVIVRLHILALLLVVLPALGRPATAQNENPARPEWPLSAQQQLPQNPMPPSPFPQNPAPEDRERTRMEKEMAKKANHQRQMEIKRDTDKLLKLATELKQYVDKSNENVLSLDVVKKAEQIEKLAHSVKEKMKNGD